MNTNTGHEPNYWHNPGIGSSADAYQELARTHDWSER